MDIITLDMETFYDKQYSLSKLTTEEYIRDPQFQVIGVSTKINDEPAVWVTGTEGDIRKHLWSLPWGSSMLLAQNTMFDGAILGWRYGIQPKALADTMLMSRALDGVDASHSLKSLAVRYGVGEKGDEVITAMGMRKEDFTEEGLAAYGRYCINDVELTYSIFSSMVQDFPMSEMRLIDLTLRMFTRPILELDRDHLEAHLASTRDRKAALLEATNADKKTLMSNPKFAEMLMAFDVEPPMKISPTTGKETYAFAKTDQAFRDLEEHGDERVRALVAARLGNKSTLEETRTERFINIAKRGAFPVPIRYYAAHTGRWGGSDRVNVQNLPSRGPNAKQIKNSIIPPPGYLLVDADSSQIEARVLAWLAEQDDLVAAFAAGEDVYKLMASSIYNKAVEDVTPEERFMGKTTILGCLAAGSQVLCERGWVPIEQVTIKDRVWDGVEWVCHKGVVSKGLKKTLNISGLWLTPDHKILCGTEWKEAQLAAHDANTRYQALGTGAENLPLQGTLKGCVGVLAPYSLGVTALELQSIPWKYITSKILNLHAALYVHEKQGVKNVIGSTLKHFLMTGTVLDCLTGYLRQFLGAITLKTKNTVLMGGAGYMCTANGATTGLNFYGMYKRWMVGTYPHSKWTASTTIKGTSRETYASQIDAQTWQTDDLSISSQRKLQTYDIAYAGPRNRYTVLTDDGPVIVHNCGYQMGAKKFRLQTATMGVDLTEKDSEHIIGVYRGTYKKIAAFWNTCRDMIPYIHKGDKVHFGRDNLLTVDGDREGVRLPSGLYIYYSNMETEQGEFGLEYTYAMRKGRKKLYGGLMTENICQALARSIIGHQMINIADKYPVVLTVHDSIVICVPEEEAEEAKVYMEACMSEPPDWAKGLPVTCEAEITAKYGG